MVIISSFFSSSSSSINQKAIMDQDPKGSIFYTDVSYSLDQVIIRKDCKIFPKCYKEGRRATTNITASSLPP